MTYCLWLDDPDCGVAADEDAVNWLQVMRERYPDAHVRMEPAPAAMPAFPVAGDEEERETPKFMHCPHAPLPAL
jgi:hypothetical protein